MAFALATILSYLTFGSSFLVSFMGSDENVSNKFVHVDVAVSTSTLKPGQQAELRLMFKPVDGIHVTIDPPVEIKVEPKGIFFLKGESRRPVDKSSGYLSSAEPVVQRFTISKNAQAGNHALKASIIYYFCSDDEGWCRKFTMPVELNFTVKK